MVIPLMIFVMKNENISGQKYKYDHIVIALFVDG